MNEKEEITKNMVGVWEAVILISIAVGFILGLMVGINI